MPQAWQVTQLVNQRWRDQVATPLALLTAYFGHPFTAPPSGTEWVRLQVLVERDPEDELFGAAGATAATVRGQVIAEYFAPWSTLSDPTQGELAAQQRIGQDIVPAFEGVEADGLRYERVAWRRAGVESGALQYVITIPFETRES